MHIVLTVLGLLGAAAFWYYRIKYIGGAASEVADAAGKMRGAYNRRKFRNKVEGSVLTAIEDPQTAASVMAVAVMMDKGVLSNSAEETLKNELETTIDVKDSVEMATFAKWVVSQSDDPDNISRKFSKMWLTELPPDARQSFLSMVQRLSAIDGEPTSVQLSAIVLLRERLGL